MSHETSFRITVGTILAAIALFAGSLLWAGNISAVVERGKTERQELLIEMRQLRKEVQDLQVQTARIATELASLSKRMNHKGGP